MSRFSRRWFLGGIATTVMAAAIACAPTPAANPAPAGTQAPSSPPAAQATAPAAATAAVQAADGKGYLLAFDIADSRVHAYRLPEMTLTGSLENIGFDNHLGTVVLADGRVIFTSQATEEVIVLKLDDQGRPAVDFRVKAELPKGGVWGQVDPTFRYLVVSSGYEEKRQVINIVDLQQRTNTALPITMNEQEELHPYITPDGLILAGIGGEMVAFRLADGQRGQTEPFARTPIGLSGHGNVIAPDLQRVFQVSARGLEPVSYAGNTLTAGTPIPWNADGRETGRNSRPRLSFDGNFVYGAAPQTQPTGAENWAQRPVDIHIANLREGTAKRLPMDQGIAPRFQLSRPYAFFAVRSPSGDAAYLFDVNAQSPSFQSIVGKVTLPALANGPVVGESASGKEGRSLAITPDGRYAFVAQGGMGQIVVIDTQSKAVASTLNVPSPMRNGGYLVAVQPGTTPVDLGAR